MSLHDFFKEKMLYIAAISIAAVLTFAIIWALNPVGGPELSLLIGSIYILGAALPLALEYMSKRAFYNNLLSVFDELDKKNLIAQVIQKPSFKEGILLYEVIKGSNKAMLEEINKYKYMQEEYREYIELWVHEIKTPIASSKLITQNNQGSAMDSVAEELEKIEDYIEQVLFYSRSNNVEKDYIIKQINIEKLCFELLKKNSKLYIQNKIGIETNKLDVIVLSDAKWLEFILKQILENAVKYSNKQRPVIKLYAKELKNSIVLSIEDNGIGIANAELPKIFDKGFTGTNGRKNERSTGMGLYLCKKLCSKLGLAISANSEFGNGTTINIIFPKSSMKTMAL